MDHRLRPLQRSAWAFAAALVLGCHGLPPRPFATKPAEPRPVADRGLDVDHYAIDLEIRPEQRAIEGSCAIRFHATTDALRTVALDLSGLEVHGVRDARGRELAYARTDERLEVTLLEPLARGAGGEFSVSYGGTPVEGLWFSGARTPGGVPTQVFTQGQADHARGWFPCVDMPSERATSEIRVVLPQDWVSFAPGERVSSTEDRGLRIERWTMTTAHPSYLASLAAGEFTVRESTWDGIPLSFAADPRYADWIAASFDETDEILAYFSEVTGIRYPYPKYSQTAVENFPWGGMENISATTLTPLTLGDAGCQRDHPSTELVAHEAAHQWFGDLFTCRDWSELWLNEGFATYFALLYFEHTRGPDEFRARLRDAQQAYVEQDRGAARRPTVWTGWKEGEDMMDTRSYGGGAARLHLLRFLLGDQAFFAGLRTYAAESTGKSVVTEDLERALEKVSGRDLDQVFEQWFHGAGYPEFELAWNWDRRKGSVVLDVHQVQSIGAGTPSVFVLPVDVEILDEGGKHTHRLQLEQRNQRFVLPVSGQPFYVQFDKYGWIPKVVTWRRGGAEWLAIAQSDDDVNARRDAVRAIGELAQSAERLDPAAHETYVGELVHRLLRDASPWVRTSAAEALGRAGGIEARERLLHASREDGSASVRIAALQALGAFGPNADLATFAAETFDERFSWATMGAAAGLYVRADPEGALDWVRGKLLVSSPHDELRGYLFAQLGGLAGRAAGDELRRWAADEGVDPSARAVALSALGGRAPESVENAKFAARFLATDDFRLRKAAIDALAKIGDGTARQALRTYYPKTRVPGERRAIEASLAAPGP